MTEHEIRKIEVEAYLYSAEEPSQEQMERLRAFLERSIRKPSASCGGRTRASATASASR